MRRDPIETCSQAGLQAPIDQPSFTVLPSKPELQKQKQLSEDVTKTNAAEKHLKQDPSPAISITTTIATTGSSGIPSQSVTSSSEDRCSQQMQSLARPKIYSENSFIVDEQLAEDECLCEVCCDLIDSSSIDELTAMSCRHTVCLRCWKLHL